VDVEAGAQKMGVVVTVTDGASVGVGSSMAVRLGMGSRRVQPKTGRAQTRPKSKGPAPTGEP
jgi:hypothetical protein